MDRYTFVLPSENQNAFACSPSEQMPFIMLYSHSRTTRRSEFFANLKCVDKFSELKMMKLKKNTSLSLSLSLSLYLSICRCTLIFPKGCACTNVPVSLSFSLFTFAKTVWIQIRHEWNSGKNVMCACDRKYAKCRTKADAHNIMGFQYISISA